MAKKKQQKKSREDPILNALKSIINGSNMSDHDFVVTMKRSAASARQVFNLSRSVRDPIRLPEGISRRTAGIRERNSTNSVSCPAYHEKQAG